MCACFFVVIVNSPHAIGRVSGPKPVKRRPAKCSTLRQSPGNEALPPSSRDNIDRLPESSPPPPAIASCAGLQQPAPQDSIADEPGSRRRLPNNATDRADRLGPEVSAKGCAPREISIP